MLPRTVNSFTGKRILKSTLNLLIENTSPRNIYKENARQIKTAYELVCPDGQTFPGRSFRRQLDGLQPEGSIGGCNLGGSDGTRAQLEFHCRAPLPRQLFCRCAAAGAATGTAYHARQIQLGPAPHSSCAGLDTVAGKMLGRCKQ